MITATSTLCSLVTIVVVTIILIPPQSVSCFHIGSMASTFSRRRISTQRASRLTEGANADDQYYFSPDDNDPLSLSNNPSVFSTQQRVTLTRYLSDLVKERPKLREMESLLLSVQMAFKTISNMVNRAGINDLVGRISLGDNADIRTYSMERLDELSTNVLRNALRFTGKVSVVEAEKTARPQKASRSDSVAESHQPGVLIASALDSKYVVVFDPLDGSGNAGASMCTGTIFGIFENKEMKGEKSAEDLVNSVFQSGNDLKSAGYCLYSSATMLVFSLGKGTHGFTLDPQLGEFVLTHANITIPQRGNVYSCNEANSIGWSDDVLSYLRALKSGENEMKTPYALRYIGSMVGDIHRTLMYGGIFWYPSDTMGHDRGNLQLLYKAMPLAYVAHHAGGKSSDGKTNLLNIVPNNVHERTPCFIGSPGDMDEMMTYVKHDEQI